MNDKNRIEVYDLSSDVVVYDVNKHEVVTDSLIFSDKAFETFPTFSPDGKHFILLGTSQGNSQRLQISEIQSLFYQFDPETRTFTGHHG